MGDISTETDKPPRRPKKRRAIGATYRAGLQYLEFRDLWHRVQDGQAELSELDRLLELHPKLSEAVSWFEEEARLRKKFRARIRSKMGGKDDDKDSPPLPPFDPVGRGPFTGVVWGGAPGLGKRR